MVIILIGVDFVVVFSLVCKEVIVVFGVCKPQSVFVRSIWARFLRRRFVNQFVPRDGRDVPDFCRGGDLVGCQWPVDDNTEIMLVHQC